jgi:transcriptional regulator with XRE-family HTH domain
MEQPQWGPALVNQIAGEIRRHRKARPWSVQQLADACEKLGWPIKRTVLSNLESGYRETITVPELFVLAQALEVPPLLLLLPLGYADTVEISPSNTVSTVDALRWLTGDHPLPGTRWEGLDTEDGSPTIATFQTHQRYVDGAINSLRNVRLAREGALGPQYTDKDAERFMQDAENWEKQLRSLRAFMRSARGLTPPPLPAELAHIEGRST